MPYAAGGPADVTAPADLQQGGRASRSVVPDRQPRATSAPWPVRADGYTLTVITPAQIINMTLFANPGYNVGRDFTPVSLFNTAPGLLLAHPRLGVSSFAEMVALAKSKPGQLSFRRSSSSDDGDDQDARRHRHGACALSRLGAGPERSARRYCAADDQLDRHGLAAREIRFVARARGFHRQPFSACGGHSDHRGSRLAGFEASLWYGVVAPAGTPSEVVAVLGAAIEAALKLPEIRERLLALGSTPADPAGPPCSPGSSGMRRRNGRTWCVRRAHRRSEIASIAREARSAIAS